MSYKKFLLFLLIAALQHPLNAQSKLPVGFVYLDQHIPNILVDLKYNSSDNFIGQCIDGYENERIICTLAAANNLEFIQADLKKEGLTLYVFDAYRPQQSVNHFATWAKDLQDTIQKQKFYPSIHKNQLFIKGYIASYSRHSSGSTLDLTLATLDGKILNMGSPFDFFGEISHVNYPHLTPLQLQNRKRLQDIMNKHGFISYPKEWWHFTLRNEPFRNQYFDFKVQ